MTSSLSNSVNNVATGIHKIIFKYANDNKKYETYRTKYNSSECCLQQTNVKDALIEFKYLCCNKNYQKKFVKC